MKMWSYILEGFGFANALDFNKSLLGFINEKIIAFSMFVAGFASVSEALFGVNSAFMIAYAVLIIFEAITGIKASKKRGEKIESRKMGRMLLKLGVYSTIIYFLNQFKSQVSFPKLLDFELDPFNWLYWTALMVIIWQLFVSLLENLDDLNYKFAGVLLQIINKKFYEGLKIDKDKS